MFCRNLGDPGKTLILFFVGYSGVFVIFALTLRYTFPFLTGLILSWILQPVLRLLRIQFHFRPGVAAAIVTLLLFSAVIALLFFLSYWLICELMTLISYLRGLNTDFFVTSFPPLNGILERFSDYLEKIDPSFFKGGSEPFLGIAKTGMDFAAVLLGSVLRFLSSLPTTFTMLIVLVFSTYFFSKDLNKLRRRFFSLFSENMAGKLRFAAKHGINVLGKYLLSCLVVYFLTFLETLLVFSLLRIPYPLVLSLIAGIADVIPILGPGIVYLPLALTSFFQGEFFTAFALLFGWLLICAVRQIVEPRLISATIHLHPLWVLAALYFSLLLHSFLLLLYLILLPALYEILSCANILPRFGELILNSHSSK